MAIELTYSDDADQDDLDRAILMTLGRKVGYVVELTYTRGHSEDVVVQAAPSGETLYCQIFNEAEGKGVGPSFAVDRIDIAAIKIY